MKKLLLKTSFLALLAGSLAGTAQAALITNPGFETGDFTGWLYSHGPSVGVLSSYTATPTSSDGRTYTGPEGKFFAVVVGGGAADGYTSIAQQFDMNAGDVLKGYSAFDAREPRGYADGAIALIKVANASTLLYFKNVPVVGDTGSSPWESWSFVAPVAGTYCFGFAVGNAVDNDNRYNSVGLLDLEYISSPVPDAASSMLLLGCAVSGLEGLRRRFKRA